MIIEYFTIVLAALAGVVFAASPAFAQKPHPRESNLIRL